MNELKIRDVQIEDAERLVEIYSYYVLNTAVSFEYAVPTVEEFENRIRNITQKYPYLVCEREGKIVGYVYASSYSSREAYSWTIDTSIYVDKDCRRLGVGSLVHTAVMAVFDGAFTRQKNREGQTVGTGRKVLT